MSIKARVVKLESNMKSDTDPLKIGRFIVDPGNLKPIGYCCDGVELIRKDNESVDHLQMRCFDSVNWPVCNHRMIFSPIYN